jgi:energy-coupling factor transporter transmembrane protein EcfT
MRGVIGYIPSESIVSKLNPVTKLLIFILMATAAALAYFVNLYIMASLFLISIVLLGVAKVPSFWMKIATFVFIMQLIGTITTNIFFPPGLTPIVEGQVLFRWWWFIVTDKAVIRILHVAFLFFSMAYTTLFLISSTTQRDLVLGLRTLKVPYSLCFLLTMIFRSAGLFLADYAIIREAKEGRGIDFSKGSIIDRLKKYMHLLGPLIVLFVRRASVLSASLESKGFGAKGNKPSQYRVVKLKSYDYLLIFGFATLVALAFINRILVYFT